MGNKFIIPSIFTAVDELSPKMITMRHNVLDFGNKAEASIARAERVFRKLTPGIGAAQKQLLSMVGTGAVLAGGFRLGSFSFDAITAHEDALDSFHSIVSNLSQAEFQQFENKIAHVAKTTRRSSVEVAESFEKIAGLNASFAETADGLGLVSKASITLAKAARMELGTASENLVGIMNQFSLGATQASRTINVLAAGQAVGAANITQTAEAFVNFGSVAAGANIPLEQSVALVQTLGKFSLFSADAGTALRGAILRLQQAGLGYASGQFNIIDALEQTNSVMARLKTAREKDLLLNKVFGAHQIVAGRILTGNIDLIRQFTREVSDTSEATRAADINSGNLRTALSELSAEWVNILTTSEGAASGVGQMTEGVKWLTNNLETLLDVTVSTVKWVALVGGGIWAAKKAMAAWNVTLGISTALTGASSIAMAGNSTALAAQAVALQFTKTSLMGHTAAAGAATMAQWNLNAALAANPVGAVTLGVMALASAVAFLTIRHKQLREEHDRMTNMRIEAAQNGEIQRLNNLIDKYTKLGITRKEAAAMAIEEERNRIGIELAKVESEIENLKSRANDKKITWKTMMGATGFIRLPGFGAVMDQLHEKRQQSIMLESEKLRLTNFAIAKTREGAPKQSQLFTEADKFTGNELASLFASEPSSADVKSELTVKIENNSDNPVTVNQGRTKVADVMPKTTSTKQVRSNYGN